MTDINLINQFLMPLCIKISVFSFQPWLSYKYLCILVGDELFTTLHPLFPQTKCDKPIASLSLFPWIIFWPATFLVPPIQIFTAKIHHTMYTVKSFPIFFIFHWCEASSIQTATSQKTEVNTEQQQIFVLEWNL